MRTSTIRTSVTFAAIALLMLGPDLPAVSAYETETVASSDTTRFAVPNATFKYAERDTCDLYLDIYLPEEGSATSLEGRAKPTVLWIFGGGFFEGQRNDGITEWFRLLQKDGYSVVAIDYRLGLKGVSISPGINPKFIKAVAKAIDMGVEDLYSATLWINDNGDCYGLDANNIVLAGASAGAIIALQAEFDITNGKPLSSVLPEDFNYKGIMSFSGAAYCFDWNLRFAKEPCPIAFFHGTDDSIVPYRKISFLQVSMKGSDALVKTMKKSGYNNYNIYRFPDHGHEIAVNMGISYPEEMRFLEENVVRGQTRTIDAFVYDPVIPTPKWESNGFKQLYE